MLSRNAVTNKKPSSSFKPDFISDSVKDIDFVYLKKLGVTTCFIDLDGTVVSRGTFEIDPEVTRILKNCQLDIKIATNRPKSRTLKNLKNQLNASGVIHPVGLYGKPTRHYIRHALAEYGLQRHQVVMIGDRYIQDIFGANRSGIYSLVVYKLGSSIGIFDKLISALEKYITVKFASSYKEI